MKRTTVEFLEHTPVQGPRDLFERIATGRTVLGDWHKLKQILETARENGLDVG